MPALVVWGTRDPYIPARFARAYADALGQAQLEEYPDAGHSFMNRINTGPGVAHLVRLVGLDYRHASSEDSWRRILDFFDVHLRRTS